MQDSAIFVRLGGLLMLMTDKRTWEEKRTQGLELEGKDISTVLFFFLKNLCIYLLFIFGCVGSSLLRACFL